MEWDTGLYIEGVKRLNKHNAYPLGIVSNVTFITLSIHVVFLLFQTLLSCDVKSPLEMIL